jgi:hypothetical protein
MFDDAIRVLEEENFIVARNHTIRIVTLGESNIYIFSFVVLLRLD